MSATRRQVHTLTSFAKVRGATISYPAEASEDAQEMPSSERSQTQSVTKITVKEGEIMNTTMLTPELEVGPGRSG